MIINLIPIIAVIVLGYLLTRFKFMDDTMSENLKKLVVNVTLPAGLFSSFIGIRFELKYVLVFASVYVTCVILLYLGKLIAKLFKIKNRFFPFLLTGFEAGMIGYALFTAAYGSDLYSTFGIVDIGQVSFVFTIMVPMILAIYTADTAEKKQHPIVMSAKTAAKSPVVWAIVFGLTLSILGIWRLEDNAVYKGIMSIFAIISAPTGFLICLVIGNGVKLSFKGMKVEILTSVIRLVLTTIFAILIKFLVFDNIGMDEIYVKALFVMFVLPAPYVIPAFMSNPTDEDKSFVANTLSIQTMLGLLGYILIIALL